MLSTDWEHILAFVRMSNSCSLERRTLNLLDRRRLFHLGLYNGSLDLISVEEVMVRHRCLVKELYFCIKLDMRM